MRFPGTDRRIAIARTSLAASHSLRTALPPLALKLSTTESSSSVTFDFSSVVAPRVPFSFMYDSLPGRIAVRATSSITAASANSRVGAAPDRCIRNGGGDFGQSPNQFGEPMRLALLADLLPVRMIAILQPAGSVSAD